MLSPTFAPYFNQMLLIDTHTHHYSQQFNEDREKVLLEAVALGVEQFLLPNVDLDSIKGMHQLCEDFPQHCKAMMGIHPCSIKEDYKEMLEVAKKYIYENSERYCAIGEIGIDLYWDKTFINEQKKAFRIQIEWAKELELPIVIHARESFNEIFEIVDELNDEKLRGVFHCFTGTLEQARHIIDYGRFLMGIGGVITFKNSGLDKVVEQIDLKHFVLETDAPYLAPTPHRGQRNQSTYLPLIAQKLAEVKGKTLEEIADITSRNAIELFQLNG